MMRWSDECNMYQRVSKSTKYPYVSGDESSRPTEADGDPIADGLRGEIGVSRSKKEGRMAIY
jgi:hypothetical protein